MDMNTPSIDFDESPRVAALDILETIPWEDGTCTNDNEEMLAPGCIFD